MCAHLSSWWRPCSYLTGLWCPGCGGPVVAEGAGHRLLLVPAPAKASIAGIVGRHQRLVRNVIIDHVIRRVKYYTIIIGFLQQI